MKNRKRHIGKIIIIVICVVAILVSLAFIVKYFIDKRNSQMLNSSISEMVETQTDDSGDVSYDYSQVEREYQNVVGWINIPNTNINYPVVKYVDNDYYLKHNILKEYDRRGAIFLDYRNDAVNLDSNTVIYGHNCYDKTMFSELSQYDSIEFYKKTPVFRFDTLEQSYTWKIYAVFITSADENEDNGYVFNYIYPYMDGENFDGFINEVNKRRLYVTDVDINDDDKMLVLSTCVRNLDTKGYRADARLVVLARAVRDGESADVDVTKAYVNKNPKYPQLYYDNKNIENPYKDDEKWYPREVAR